MMIDVKEVARLLSVSEKTIYRWISGNEIPAYKVGQSYRFNRVELLEWATSRKIKVSHEIFEEGLSLGDETPSLITALEAGGIHYHVPGNEKGTVLKSIVDLMRLPDDVDRDFLSSALIARENLGTTAIGDGIAIPHVRNPIVFHIGMPVLSLCFLESPIDFGALDGKPVDTVFTLMTPNIRSHLHLLSRLSYALHLPDARVALSPRSTAAEIIEAFSKVETQLKASGGKN